MSITKAIGISGNATILTPAGAAVALGGVISNATAIAGKLIIAGAGTVVLSAANTYSGGTAIQSGGLQIQADNNLGASVGDVEIFNGATLGIANTMTTTRDFVLAGTTTFAIPSTKTVTINGVVSDSSIAAGSIVVVGGGKLILGNQNNAFSGSYTMPAGTVRLNGTTTTLAGQGTVSITMVPGSGDIASIVLAGTNSTTKLSVNGPATTGVFSISIPNANDHIDSIFLGNNVLFGNGVMDATPDLLIAGKANSVTLGDVNRGAILRFGSGLPYNVPSENTTPDSYNNRPNVALRDVLGAGVTIDVLGDGTPGGTGGGGLGKVTVQSWGFPGVVKTTQSIDTFTIKRGDCFATLEVDKFGHGELTQANVNKITCITGKWNSIGTAIEGYVDKFDAGGFANAATLTAGYVQTRMLIKGTYLEPGNISLGGTITLTSESASALFDIRIGSFSGTVNAQGTIANFICTGNFSGTLIADQIVTKVQALKFIDNGVSDARIKTVVGGIGAIVASAGGITNTNIQSAGNIGAITTTGSGATRSIVSSHIAAVGSITGPIKVGTSGTSADISSSHILSGADLGADGEIGGVLTNADTWFGGTSIGDVSIYGVMTGSIIAASIHAGADGIFGNPTAYGGDDTALAGGAIGKVSLASTAFTGKVIGTDNAIAHTNAVMGTTINGIYQLASTLKVAAAIINGGANVARDLRVAGPAVGSDLLLFTF